MKLDAFRWLMLDLIQMEVNSLLQQQQLHGLMESMWCLEKLLKEWIL